jgi:hypothetical protein
LLHWFLCGDDGRSIANQRLIGSLLCLCFMSIVRYSGRFKWWKSCFTAHYFVRNLRDNKISTIENGTLGALAQLNSL